MIVDVAVTTFDKAYNCEILTKTRNMDMAIVKAGPSCDKDSTHVHIHVMSNESDYLIAYNLSKEHVLR